MIRIKSVAVDNFRGFNKYRQFDLSGSVILFYGLNGRGKSSVFTALEFGLYPEEKAREFREEAGSKAPLTNRFNQAGIGTIEIVLSQVDEDDVKITQAVTDDLDRIQSSPSAIRSKVVGQRYRMFITQRLLRDLVLGTPYTRYERVKQILGCNTYDALASSLAAWDEEIPFSSYMLDSLISRLSGALQEMSGLAELWPDNEPSQVLDSLRTEGISSGTAQRLYVEMVSLFQRMNAELSILRVKEEVPPTDFRQLQRVCNKYRNQTREIKDSLLVLFHNPPSSVPLRIRRVLFDILPGAESLLKEIQMLIARRQASRSFAAIQLHMPESQLGSDDHLLEMLHFAGRDDLVASHKAELSAFRTGIGAWQNSVSSALSRVDWFHNAVKRLADIAHRLNLIENSVEPLRQLSISASPQGLAQLKRYRDMLLFAQCLFQAVMQLTQAKIEERATRVTPIWNRYYRQLSSYSHFQSLGIQTEAKDSSNRMFYWDMPDEWGLLRFTVEDPKEPQTEGIVPMESLLSEGQLNCAAVSLALALTELKAPTLKMLALDDPFVSWDDVNMENFFAAVRTLAMDGWTIILSTCDRRVVSVFKKNMETLPRRARVYTFRNWTKEYGPRIDESVVLTRDTKHLSQLGDQFDAELLEDLNGAVEIELPGYH